MCVRRGRWTNECNDWPLFQRTNHENQLIERRRKPGCYSGADKLFGDSYTLFPSLLLLFKLLSPLFLLKHFLNKFNKDSCPF